MVAVAVVVYRFGLPSILFDARTPLRNQPSGLGLIHISILLNNRLNKDIYIYIYIYIYIFIFYRERERERER